MTMQFITIILVILFVLLGVKLVHVLQKKGVFLNRWIFGIAAFLVVMLPAILFTELPQTLRTVSYLLCGLFAVMFFETGRLMLERNQVKGLIQAKHFPKTKKS